MSDAYGAQPRAIQDEFDSRPPADRVVDHRGFPDCPDKGDG